MSLEIEILEEKKNPLINRMELKFRIEHFGKGTPNRLEIKKKISALKSSNDKLTIIKKIKTHFGNTSAIGKAYIYENAKDLQFHEPFHIQVRNIESDKRDEIYKLKKKKEPFQHLFEYAS